MAVHLNKNVSEGTITMQHQTQTFDGQGMVIEVHGEITMPIGEWRGALDGLRQMTEDGGPIASVRG